MPREQTRFNRRAGALNAVLRQSGDRDGLRSFWVRMSQLRGDHESGANYEEKDQDGPEPPDTKRGRSPLRLGEMPRPGRVCYRVLMPLTLWHRRERSGKDHIAWGHRCRVP